MEDTDNAPPDVPDLAGLQGARPADGPAGWLLFPGAPDGPDGVQQEPKRSEVLIDLVTRAYVQWARALHHSLIKFDECRLGQVVVKSTALSTDLPLHH